MKVNEPLSLIGATGLYPQVSDLAQSRDLHRRQAQDAQMFAATWAKRRFDSKHKKINLEEGDLVYLRLHRGYNLPGLKNPKLSNQRAGPFKILKKISTLAYRLEIPRTMQIHPVISIAHLEPCLDPKADPYHHPRPTNPPPVMEELGEWQPFKVEKVLESRQQQYRRGKTMTEYLVRWKGYGPQHNKWYGEDLLEGCLETLINFESAKGNAEAVDRLQTRLAALDLEPEAEPQQSSDTKERSLATAASMVNTTSKLDTAQVLPQLLTEPLRKATPPLHDDRQRQTRSRASEVPPHQLSWL